MNPQFKKGVLELIVLESVRRKDMYGYEMIDTLSKRSNNVFELKVGTLYPLLHSLVQGGYLNSYDQQVNGKLRKYYQITPGGRKYLDRMIEEWTAYAGGKLIVYPPRGVTYKKDENIIIGNVAFYGATSGKAYIGGVAGERFCVRNSGVRAVAEGTGDHGCEYMTGGCVVILGQVGKNFAAGMSGGVAYVLDEDQDLYTKVNKAMVSLEEVTNKYDVQELKDMIKEHVAYTNSEKGKRILDHFEQYLPKFKKIIPNDYKRMLSMIVQMEEKGMNTEQAQIEAFYAVKRG